MSRNNNANAWEEINNAGLMIDAQTYQNEDGTHTAYVGIVDKGSRWFTRFGFGKQTYNNEAEARRSAQAVARVASRRSGVPLHPSIPAGGQKQVSSRTIGQAQLRVMFDMDKRQKERDFDESSKGKFLFWVSAILFGAAWMGLLALGTWVMSLIG